jgi:hypothetical protein
MRVPVVCTIFVLGFSLLSCREAPRFVNADELARAPNTAGGAAPCNDLVQLGDEVDLRGSRAPAPVPAGGAIADGTYVLTSTTLHTKDQPEGAMLVGLGKATMVVNGSTSQMVRNTVNGRERRTTVNRVSDGTVTTLQTTCTFPSPTADATSMVAYTATASSIQFITPGPAGTVVATYTKVPPAPEKIGRLEP